MLMCYFINHFNTREEIKIFYSKVKNLIKTNTAKKTNYKISINKLNYLIDLINRSNFNVKSPYNSILIQNGIVKTISLNEKNIIKINNKTFADCADVTVRHIINFLLYNGDEMFNLVQGGKQEDLNKLIDAINNNGEVEYKSLKERLQLFYLYQTKDKVNDGSILTRTLWNYVISNMNDTEQMTSLNMYPIQYVKNKTYELGTGFINMMKLCYNLAYALKNGQGCDEAKIAIDKLNEKSSKEDLKEALEKTLKILNPDANVVNLEFLKKNADEVYGEVRIKIGLIDFDIYQNPGHAYIGHKALKNDGTCNLYDFDTSEINENIEIPEKIKKDDKEYIVTSINNSVFVGCQKLISIKFPKSLKKIGKLAFDYCTNLEIIEFEEDSSLEDTDKNAFRACKSLKNIIKNKFMKKD